MPDYAIERETERTWMVIEYSDFERTTVFIGTQAECEAYVRESEQDQDR